MESSPASEPSQGTHSAEPTSAADEPSTGSGHADLPILELRNLRKSFGNLAAVDGVSLAFARGEVHAILGENGAGKTTLMNLTAGFLAPDAGSVVLDGQPTAFRMPREAFDGGIGMVQQHSRLIEQLTVAENLAIGATDVQGVVRRSSLEKRASSLAARFGLAVDPRKFVWQLSAGEKRRVDILRTLSREVRVLILDEPTSVLTPSESETLFGNLRKMVTDLGISVIFISHKLREVAAVADQVSVMRRGQLVTTLPRARITIENLARLMVGDDYTAAGGTATERLAASTSGEKVLEVNDLVVYDDRKVLALNEISFHVNAGEILGVAGVAGNGQKELEEILAGVRAPVTGEVRINGKDAAAKARRKGKNGRVGYIPEERQAAGLVVGETIWRNAVMRVYRRSPIRRGPLLSSAEAKTYTQGLVGRVKLSTDNVEETVDHLSGGNAQKLLVGRELDGDVSLLVAVNPTQGLDIGAAAAVRDQLMSARERGVAILLISADLDEVLDLADRLVVMYEGKLVEGSARGSWDRARIGLLMGGGQVDGGDV